MQKLMSVVSFGALRACSETERVLMKLYGMMLNVCMHGCCDFAKCNIKASPVLKQYQSQMQPLC